MKKLLLIGAALVIAISLYKSSNAFAKSEVESEDGEVKTFQNQERNQEREEKRLEIRQLNPSASPKVKPSSKPSPKLTKERVREEEREMEEENEGEEDNATGSGKRETEQKGGARFVYDAASKTVTLLTPSGNEKELKLSEKAIENMIEHGFFVRKGLSDDSDGETKSATKSSEATDSALAKTEEAEFTEETNEAGESILTTEFKDERKLFGIIPVKVQSKFEINAKTGESKISPKSLWGRLFSFMMTE